MRSIRKSHVFTVSFRFERQIAEEGSREATRATALRRGLRVAALQPLSGEENLLLGIALPFRPKQLRRNLCLATTQRFLRNRP
ncbi:hypothetical protein RCS94_07785 [Orbaceae bacterium ac157xtp]